MGLSRSSSLGLRRYSQARPLHGRVFYDAECAFCLRVVRWFGPTLLARGFELHPLQNDLARQSFQLPAQELVQDIRMLLANGRALSGADVYRYLLKQIWWAWPVGAAASLPGFHRLFDTVYRWVATHRSKAGCRRS